MRKLNFFARYRFWLLGLVAVFIVYFLLSLFDLQENITKQNIKFEISYSPIIIEYEKINENMETDDLDYQKKYKGTNLNLQYEVVSNLDSKKMHHIFLTNIGENTIENGDWSIYFTDLHLIEFDHIEQNKSYMLPKCDFLLEQMDGSLYKLSPTKKFKGIKPNETVSVIYSSYITAARCYILPRWYVKSASTKPVLISCTDDETLSFVEKFEGEKRYKMSKNDNAHPYSLQERYDRFNVEDLGQSPIGIIPTPLKYKLYEGKEIDFKRGDWYICNQPESFKKEIDLFSDLFGMKIIQDKERCPEENQIHFMKTQITEVPNPNEAYEILIDNKKLTITSSTSTGIFYAIQSLLSLHNNSEGKLPIVHIKDSPRFEYRGLHIDVSRNFIQPKEIIKIIKALSMYKLNKLHLHLTDDEGWRIEIPGLPELTQVGAQRKHTEDENDCLFPALGSGPFGDTSGSGFYSVSEYRDILRFAADNHMEVIPEIDIPGHSHAAIKSMKVRYERYMKEGNKEKAEEYLLHDVNDESTAISVQHYRNNGMNPCMKSTLRFVDHVVSQLIDLHSDIQPLQTFHVGGDEVARGSWGESPVCNDLIDSSDDFPHTNKDLQEYFLRQVSEICGKKYGIKIGVWDDGLVKGSPNDIPFNKSALHNADILAYDWSNTWLKNTEDRAHILANAGYKVIMAQATHLYFDHPHEPDPEELGLFWATRSVDEREVFNFRPDDVLSNAHKDYNSNVITDKQRAELRERSEVLRKPDNIIGMQAELWSELIRGEKMAHSQLFPRIIAFAERAWHKSNWENMKNENNIQENQQKDWTNFANIVGYKELPRLKKMGIYYRISPPGVKFHDKNGLQLTSTYPGFKYKHRPIKSKADSDWVECKIGEQIKDFKSGHMFVTWDEERYSRPVQ